MRNPGRTAVTARALMIGVALVTAVTVVAQGLEDQSSRPLERHVQAHDDRHRRRRLVADRPARSSRPSAGAGARQLAAPGRRARVRQPGGRQRRRSRHDRRLLPLRLRRPAASRPRPRRRDRQRGLRRRSTACSVGSTFAVTSMSGKTAAADRARDREVARCSTCSASARSRSRTPRSTRRSSSAQPADVRRRPARRGRARRSPPSRTPRSRARTPSSTARRRGSA